MTPLPDGSLLLHIGPPQAGASSIAAALRAARRPAHEQGVRVVGPDPGAWSTRVPAAVADDDTPAAPPLADWRALGRQAGDRGRSILSSTSLAHADDATIRQVTDVLGAGRLHVVVTLAPLARIIPATWQHDVRAGLRTPLDAWAGRLFAQPDAGASRAFWRLHRHDVLVARWAASLAAGHVHVLVDDATGHTSGARAFESLLGLAPGTLALPGARGRALTYEEAEAVRAFNVASEAGHLDPALRTRIMRFGAAEHMARLDPATGDLPVPLPVAVRDDVGRASEEIVAAIRVAGVHVVGDLERLLWLPEPTDADPLPATSPEAAARMAMGIVRASGQARRSPSSTTPEQAREDAAILALVPGDVLRASLAARVRLVSRVQARRLVGVVRRSPWSVRRRVRARLRTAPWKRASTTPARSARPARRPVATPVGRIPVIATSTGEPVAPLPSGSILVHIGPPKTGTTAIQASLDAARDAIEQQGVHYAGKPRHSISAVHAFLGHASFRTDGPPALEHWVRLREEILASPADRIVLSSEFFADASPEKVGQLLDELGRDRVHIVVTLRPLARIIPSQWQQYVQSGIRSSLESWLGSILADPPGPLSPSFWRRHHDDQLIERWAAVAGRDRVTAIVLDERDHAMILRAFEALTGLDSGTLTLQEDLANRSLSMPEIEVVRHLNEAFTDAGMTRPQHSALVNFGATEYLKTLPVEPGAPKVILPGFAFERTATVAREIVAGIRASGVRLIGDTERLLAVPAPETGQEIPDVSRISGAVAGRLSMGIVYAAGLAMPPGTADDAPVALRQPVTATEPMAITSIPTRTLIVALVRRALPRGGR